MITGLVTRDGRYSAKQVIPSDLQAAYGKRVIVKALNTSDYAEAKRRNLQFRTAMEAEFQLKRAERQKQNSGVLSPAEAPTKAVYSSQFQTMSDDQFEYEMDRLAFYEAEEARENYEFEAREDARERYESVALADVATLTADERALRDVIDVYRHNAEVAKDRLDASLLAIAQQTVAEEPPQASPVEAAKAKPATASKAKVATLTDIADKWAATAKPAARTIRRTKRIIEDFETVNGTHSVHVYGREHVLAYRDWLQSNQQTIANINVLIPMLGVVFNYAANTLLLIDRSPTKGMKLPDNRKAKEKRRAFNAGELKSIFQSPVYSSDVRPVAGGGEAAYWLPILSLFTGGRQTELGQLHPDDVFEEPYRTATGKHLKAWVVQFVENPERGQWVKNEGSERRVPIHPALIDLGFIELVLEAKRMQQARIFPDIRPSAAGELMANWSKWFGRYRRKACGLLTKDIPFHSFRHTFKHYARLSEIPREVHSEITGHETGDTGDDYGGLSYPLAPLVEGIKLYRVPDFTIPRPPPKYRSIRT